MTCASCGSLPPSGARFCPQCGAELASAALPEERRVVTVLFADVAGFTALSETKDPEAVKGLLDECFGALVPVIERYGGHVDKIIGDEVMAVFGAPRAHEDDPERAVRAALDLATALEGLDLDVTLRIGINTGEVLAGAVGPGGAYTVTGDTVNTAHRLVSAAEPGMILVGPRTWSLTRQAINYQEREPLQLRGKREPVQPYAALRAARPPGAGPVVQLGAPLLGRDVELRQLVDHGLSALDGGSPAVGVIRGAPGAGKTRLALEVQLALWSQRRNVRLAWSRCPPYGEAGPLWAVGEVVRSSLELRADESPAAIAKVVVDVLDHDAGGRHADHEVVGERIAELLGSSGHRGGIQSALRQTASPVRHDRGSTALLLGAASRVLAAVASVHPLSVVMDDLQWADSRVVDWVSRLPQTVARRPIFVIGVARSDAFGPSDAPQEPAVDLEPLLSVAGAVMILGDLSEDATRELSRRLLRDEMKLPDAHVAETTVERIVSAVDGNPFFAVELVQHLGENGLLTTRDNVIEVDPSLDTGAFPDGVRTLLAARIDALDPAERSAVLNASVLGRSFSRAFLASLTEDPGADEAVGRLVRRGIFVSTPQSDGDEVSFEHLALREVAYSSLSIADRVQKHSQAARWLEANVDVERSTTNMERIAHHYSQVVALGREIDLTDPGFAGRAQSFLARAARHAQLRDANLEADRLFRGARDIGAGDVGFTAELALDHGLTLQSLGRAGEAHEAMSEAIALSKDVDRRLASLASARLAALVRAQGDLEGAEELFAQAVELLGDGTSPLDLAAVLRIEGMSLVQAGRPRPASQRLHRALDIERSAAGTPQPLTLQALGWCSILTGDGAAARELLWDASMAYARDEDISGLGWCLGILGFLFQREGRIRQAFDIARSLRDTADDLGDPRAGAIIRVLLALCEAEAGHPQNAVAHAAEARSTLEQLDDAWGLSMASLVGGTAAADLGEFERASAEIAYGLEQARAVGYPGDECRLLSAQAGVALMRGDAVGAAVAAREALAISKGGDGDIDSEILSRTTLAAAEYLGGQISEARRHIDDALGLAERSPERTASAHAQIVAAYIALHEGNVDDARALAETAARGWPESMRITVRGLKAYEDASREANDLDAAEAARRELENVIQGRALAYVAHAGVSGEQP